MLNSTSTNTYTIKEIKKPKEYKILVLKKIILNYTSNQIKKIVIFKNFKNLYNLLNKKGKSLKQLKILVSYVTTITIFLYLNFLLYWLCINEYLLEEGFKIILDAYKKIVIYLNHFVEIPNLLEIVNVIGAQIINTSIYLDIITYSIVNNTLVNFIITKESPCSSITNLLFGFNYLFISKIYGLFFNSEVNESILEIIKLKKFEDDCVINLFLYKLLIVSFWLKNTLIPDITIQNTIYWIGDSYSYLELLNYENLRLFFKTDLRNDFYDYGIENCYETILHVVNKELINLEFLTLTLTGEIHLGLEIFVSFLRFKIISQYSWDAFSMVGGKFYKNLIAFLNPYVTVEYARTFQVKLKPLYIQTQLIFNNSIIADIKTTLISLVKIDVYNLLYFYSFIDYSLLLLILFFFLFFKLLKSSNNLSIAFYVTTILVLLGFTLIKKGPEPYAYFFLILEFTSIFTVFGFTLLKSSFSKKNKTNFFLVLTTLFLLLKIIFFEKKSLISFFEMFDLNKVIYNNIYNDFSLFFFKILVNTTNLYTIIIALFSISIVLIIFLRNSFIQKSKKNSIPRPSKNLQITGLFHVAKWF